MLNMVASFGGPRSAGARTLHRHRRKITHVRSNPDRTETEPRAYVPLGRCGSWFSESTVDHNPFACHAGEGSQTRWTTTKGEEMAETIDELGPVDYLVIEFPGSNFNGEILPELAALVQRGIVRVLDLVVIKKTQDGSYEAFEFGDPDAGALGEIRELEEELADLLSEDDVTAVAEALEPGSTAGLLVYENLWAATFASAVRRSGGQLTASGRIPVQALIGAIEEEIDEEEIDNQQQGV